MVATLNNFVGWETGDNTEATGNTGTTSIQSEVVRKASYALKIAAADAGSLSIPVFLNTSDAGNNYVVGFAVRITDIGPSIGVDFWSAGTNAAAQHIRLRLLTNGNLQLMNAAGVLVGTAATTPFTINTWHFVEVYWELANSAVAEVFVDGVQVISETGEDFLNATSALELYSFKSASTSGGDYYFDDIYCLSGATAASDRLGPIDVFAYKHNKDGVTPDGGIGGTAGVDLDNNTWDHTINDDDARNAEYRADPSRGTIDFNGPGDLGIVVDPGSFYADTSDAGPTDNDAVWTGDANAFDGDITTEATCSVNGTRTTNELRGAGTTFPGTGDSFDDVKVRVFGGTNGVSGISTVEVHSDGEAELLGAVDLLPLTTTWTPWVKLTVPSGGWTRAKIQALEFIIFADSAGAHVSSIEVTTIKAVANDADILATKAHLRMDRDGGGGTVHIIGMSHSGDGDNATEFDDETDWGPITTTNTWWSVIQTTSAKLPSTTQNIRAGFGTLGAQDIHLYNCFVMLLHLPPVAGGLSATVTQVTETDVAQPITESPKIRVIGLVTETDLAQPITVDPQHRLVNQVTETDLAQPITPTFPLSATVNQVFETDLAQPITWAPKARFVTQVVETDLAQPITVDPQHRLVNQVTEIDLAQPITVETRRLVTQVTETDLAQPITVDPQHRLVNQVTETDLAQPITWAPKIRIITQVTETDLAQTITPSLGAKFIDVDQVFETDLAQPITWAPKARLVTLVTETDLAQPITVDPQHRLVNQVTETDLAQTITPSLGAKFVDVDQVFETDIAQPITWSPKARLVTLVTETDLAQPITVDPQHRLVNQVTETDLAQTITPSLGAKIVPVGQVIETDLAQPITWAPKIRVIGQVTEVDLAQPITWAPKIRIIGQVTEVDLAQPITVDPQRRLVNLVTETDLAQPITWAPKARFVTLVTETDLAQTITPQLGGASLLLFVSGTQGGHNRLLGGMAA